MTKIYCNGNIHMSHRRIMPLHHDGKVLIKWEFAASTGGSGSLGGAR
jgi:hypothetical protein